MQEEVNPTNSDAPGCSKCLSWSVSQAVLRRGKLKSPENEFVQESYRLRPVLLKVLMEAADAPATY